MTQSEEQSALIARKGDCLRQLIRDAEMAPTPERALALYLKARNAAGAMSRTARYQLALVSEIRSDLEKVA